MMSHSIKSVHFPAPSPITSVSRPLTTEEFEAIEAFEDHESRCFFCQLPQKGESNQWHLCMAGRRLAGMITHYFYNTENGRTYSTLLEQRRRVHVEIPYYFITCRELLKTTARRHRPSNSVHQIGRIPQSSTPERSARPYLDKPLPNTPRSSTVVRERHIICYSYVAK